MNALQVACAGAALMAIAPLGALAAEQNVPGKSGELYDTIMAQDAKLFRAFNACDLKTLSAMTAEDLRFFHDRGGLDAGRAIFIKSVKENVCGKFTRALEPGSVEVWPIPGYGAIEIGVHRFHHADPAEPDGIGKFMILWENAEGTWLMTETFSYAHAEAPR